jgi:hypothetical protein
VDDTLRKLAAAVVALSVVVLLLVATENTIRPGINDAGSGLEDPANCIGSNIQEGESPEECDEKIPSVGGSSGSTGGDDE